LRGLVDDFAHLAKQQVELAKREVREAVGSATDGLTSLLAGGAILFVGIIFLLLAVVLYLSLFMPPWASALWVGGVVAVIGLALLLRARRKWRAEALLPERTIRSLRKEQQLARRSTS
jgi:type II secretory pathway component PulF